MPPTCARSPAPASALVTPGSTAAETDPSAVVARRWRRAFFAVAGLVAIELVLGAGVAFEAPALIHRVAFGPGHRRQITQFERLAIAPADVVFLGDSITEAVQWHELFPAASARNRGIGGDTVDEVAARLDPIVRGHPRKLFLMVGTNDVRLRVPLDQSMAAYDRMLDRLRREAPETEVFVAGVLPRNERYAPRIRAFNARLREVAARHGAIWLDFFDAFADERGVIRPDYSNDDLHLLGAGIELWARLLAPYVNGD